MGTGRALAIETKLSLFPASRTSERRYKRHEQCFPRSSGANYVLHNRTCCSPVNRDDLLLRVLASGADFGGDVARCARLRSPM